jgi:hypothetical protein
VQEHVRVYPPTESNHNSALASEDGSNVLFEKTHHCHLILIAAL